MSSLTDPNSVALLPGFLKDDDFCKAVAKTFDDLCCVLAADKLSTFAYIDDLSTKELDDIAEELHVLWYDCTASDETKKAQLKVSERIWQTLGTPAAVEQVLTTIFGEADLLEFWQYSGQPHHFKIVLNKAGDLTAENEAKLKEFLDIVKRKSQLLDKIELVLKNKFTCFAAAFVSDISKEKIAILDQPFNTFIGGGLFSGVTIHDSSRIQISIP